ncbi:MAG TPA: beta-galactosidase family protein [Ohtaekwangia sp.]|nr:beta-galactosidase family protein [Ohtaekwangia sp.]
MQNRTIVKFVSAILFTLVSLRGAEAQTEKHTFTLGDSVFLLDGKPFQMISGELHYPRIPREAWRHRMRMAKAMGLNTIGTYVFWNLHEPEKGVFDFSGNNDIAAFVRTAQEEGLWVVLRPSPYVCAEWEFGGYPYWLQKEEGLIVRSREPKFLSAYKNYIQEVARQIAPLQVNHGGNILMIQVENEYGFYSNDKEYLKVNKQLFIDAGFDGLLYTCDPAAKVGDGYLPGLLPAVNGVSDPDVVKSLVKKYHNDKGPFYIAEWYPAWFDWWGTPHHTVPAAEYTSKLDSILAAGISVNMYMFHGGTTRGFMNGANDNDKDPYEPQISSYDYDAPLDEAGNITDKFIAFRRVIEKHIAPLKLPPLPSAKPAVQIPPIEFKDIVQLDEILPKATENTHPLTFENLNQAYGYVLYRTKLNDAATGWLRIKGLRDYAIVYVNGRRQGVLDRRFDEDSLYIELPSKSVTLDILVENMGRINFGPYMLKNKKGITHNVTLNDKELLAWQMFRFPFDNINETKLKPGKVTTDLPVLMKTSFSLRDVKDTYFDMSAWGKGCVWVNGHHLGRYWSLGPQQTIYVPAEWLKKGQNEVVVLELTKTEQRILQSTSKPVLNRIQTSKSP